MTVPWYTESIAIGLGGGKSFAGYCHFHGCFRLGLACVCRAWAVVCFIFLGLAMHTLISGWTFSTREFGQPPPLLLCICIPVYLFCFLEGFVHTYLRKG